MVALISLYLYRQVKIERIQRVGPRMGHLGAVGLWIRYIPLRSVETYMVRS